MYTNLNSVGKAAIIRLCWFWLAVIGIATAPSPVLGQWTQDGADFSGRFKEWVKHPQDPFSPDKALGASSLAFGPDETLYLACEKYPDLLIFNKDASRPTRKRLEGVEVVQGVANVDFEAMSIHEGVLYLMDEDPVGEDETNLRIYSTPLDNLGPVKTIRLEYVGVKAINPRTTDGNPSNRSSVEGLVVTNTSPSALHVPKADCDRIGDGPYVYLLDERDDNPGGQDAKLYIGALREDRVLIVTPPISFDLGNTLGSTDEFRLPELFEHQGKLHALKTRVLKDPDRVYQVVQCDLEAGAINLVCDFSIFANGPKMKGYDSNFEGAAVNPVDGRLFLTADNENYSNKDVRKLVKGGQLTPRPASENGRGRTPIITLKAKPQ